MRIGVIGAGQLGRMLALAGIPLGARFVFLDPNPASPARGLGDFIEGDLSDPAKIATVASRVDVLTCEVENVAAAALDAGSNGLPVRPAAAALALAQDRLAEKTLFRELNIATPEFHPVDSAADLERAVATVGLPCVLKRRRLGFDGRGQRFLREPGDLAAALVELGSSDLIVEAFVNFDYELSVIGARGQDGQIAVWPLARNEHRDGILWRSDAPFAPPALQQEAEQLFRTVAERLDYVGVLTIEFFHAGGLVANEIAPRVHNSGHWTIEGAQTSQFENHIRAILGLPLGSTAARGSTTMLNCLGRMPSAADALRQPGVHYHDYGKAARAKRKVGHLTVTANERRDCDAIASRLESLLAG